MVTECARQDGASQIWQGKREWFSIVCVAVHAVVNYVWVCARWMEPVTEGKKQLCAMCRYAWCLVTVHVLGEMKQASAWKIGKCYAVSVCVCVMSHCAWPDRASQSRQAKEVICVCVCCGWSPWETRLFSSTQLRVRCRQNGVIFVLDKATKMQQQCKKTDGTNYLRKSACKTEYCKDVFSLSQVGVCMSVLLVTLLVSSTELDAERTSLTVLG